jgi:nicotinamide-nucleotide amidase
MTRFEPLVLTLAQALRERGLKLATAESCTGGLIAAACTRSLVRATGSSAAS